MIRFAGITEIFRLIFRQCSTTSPDLFGCGRLGPIRLHLVIFSDVATTASAIHYLPYAVSTCPHEAWQRTLRKSSILDRLHPIGFSRGGV